MDFSDSLKQIRRERGFTQRDVYEWLHVSPNCYASWEQGRTQPDIENIKRLCSFFQVSSDRLLGLEGDDDIY